MNSRAIVVSYMQSLLWIALFMALMRAEANIVELLFIDFVHGNPHRTQDNAICMMKASTPVFAVIAFIGTFLVFTLPQFLQAEVILAVLPASGDESRFAVFGALPVTALLTWYCYDYLTPSNVSFAGNLTEMYEHGLSPSRYMMTLAIQTPVTLFGFLYFNADLSGRAKKPVVLAAFAVAVVIGATWGYVRAQAQYQFLS